MKRIFTKSFSLQLRLFFSVIVSIIVIIVDSQLETFINIRTYMDIAVSPFYFLANSQRKIFDHISQILTTRTQLELENLSLRQKLLLNNSEQMLLDQYKKENDKLRELLGSPLREDEKKILTKVISVSLDPYSDQVVIDKGINNGVYIGQAVINNKGVVGQVIATSQFTSRVLLICDSAHALPIQVLRNDIRMNIAGNGCSRDLYCENFPGNIDIRIGDLLVTSGLGNLFPAGYPVAVVSSIKIDEQRSYTIILARPTAGLHHLHYLLLLWNINFQIKFPLSPNDIHKVANERLMLPYVLSSLDDTWGKT